MFLWPVDHPTVAGQPLNHQGAPLDHGGRELTALQSQFATYSTLPSRIGEEDGTSFPGLLRLVVKYYANASRRSPRIRSTEGLWSRVWTGGARMFRSGSKPVNCGKSFGLWSWRAIAHGKPRTRDVRRAAGAQIRYVVCILTLWRHYPKT